MTEATDRSISPAMITNVIVTTTMIFSMCSWNRLTKLSTAQIPARLREVEDRPCPAGSPPSSELPGVARAQLAMRRPPWTRSTAWSRARSRSRRPRATSSRTARRIRAPEDRVTPELADLLDADEALVEHPDQHRAEEHAEDGAGAAERADAADDGRGDGGQLEAGAGRDVDRAEAADVQEAGEAGEGTAGDERHDLDAPLVQPGLAGGLRVRAEGVEVPARPACTAARDGARRRSRGPARTSCAPRTARCVKRVLRGRSTSHAGSEPVEIVSPPAWPVSRLRKIESVPSVTMIDGTLATATRTPLTTPSTAPTPSAKATRPRPAGRGGRRGAQP